MRIFSGGALKFACVAAPVLFCVAFALLSGKDLNWDALNYHYYLPMSLFEGRVHQDFYAAGPQSYLNPLGYSLFYILVKAIPHSWVVAVVLAISHSLIIYVLFAISSRVILPQEGEEFFRYKTCLVGATVLGLSTTMFLQLVGSSFIDIYVSTFILFALFLVLKTEGKKLELFAWGGVCGFALAIKPTALMFVLPIYITLAIKSLSVRWGWVVWLGASGVACVASFLVLSGYWLYVVYERTGNPVFPLLNQLFCSDYYFCQGFTHFRFLKESVWELLLWPIYVVAPSPWLYSELTAPDIRFLIMILFFGFSLFFSKNIRYISSRALLLYFFFLSMMFWLLVSGNGRYGLPVFLLVGPLLVSYVREVVGKRWAVSSVAVVGIVQLALLSTVKDVRWSELEYSGEWFDYSIPSDMLDRSHFYVSLDKQSLSFMAGKVHPKSSFFNIGGQVTLPFNGRVEDEFNKLAFMHQDRIRVLTYFYNKESEYSEGELKSIWVEKINRSVARVGLVVDSGDRCGIVEPKIEDPNLEGLDYVRSRYFYCDARRDISLISVFREEAKTASGIMNDLEALCPEWFSPSRAVTEEEGTDYVRTYAGTDLRVSVNSDQVVWVRFSDRLLPWAIGKVGSWEQDRLKEGICDYQYPKLYKEIWH